MKTIHQKFTAKYSQYNLESEIRNLELELKEIARREQLKEDIQEYLSHYYNEIEHSFMHNGALYTSTITEFTSSPDVRVSFIYNFKKAQLKRILKSQTKVLNNPIIDFIHKKENFRRGEIEEDIFLISTESKLEKYNQFNFINYEKNRFHSTNTGT